MASTLHKLSPQDVQTRLAAGQAVVVDIREADEFARSHIPGAHSQPLSALEQAHLSVEPGQDVLFS
jgi:rhodanese-related sulfurtransferase